VNLFQVLGRSLLPPFLLRLSIWLLLVAVVAAILMALLTTVVVVVLVAIGHQWLARTLVVTVQPKRKWWWRLVSLTRLPSAVAVRQMRQVSLVLLLAQTLRRLAPSVVVVAKAQTLPPTAVQAAAVILPAPQAEQVRQMRAWLVVSVAQVASVRVAVAVQAQ
jgi:hypothetical protein